MKRTKDDLINSLSLENSKLHDEVDKLADMVNRLACIIRDKEDTMNAQDEAEEYRNYVILNHFKTSRDYDENIQDQTARHD